MKQDASQHHDSETVSEQDTAIIELSLEEIESVSGGPQITNDGYQPPS